MLPADRDLITRLALIVAAVVLAVLTAVPGEAVWGLLGALVPTPRVGETSLRRRPPSSPPDGP